MNKYNDDLFIKRYPKIDLHGETRDTMVFLLKSFINDNIKLRNEYIVVIHGIGEGILKEQTHKLLKQDKRVKSYYTGMCNPGCTVVQLTLDKNKQK